MHKNFLQVAERLMEEARVCADEKLVHKVASAVDAILMHFSEQKKPAGIIEDETAVFSFPKNCGPPPTIKSIAAKLEKAEKLQAVVDKLGSWASAAQDDPGCCKELKAIFLEVCELADPDKAYDDWPVPAGEIPALGPTGAVGPSCPAGEPAFTTALDVLRTLNGIHPLGDFVYTIRENEGEGWEGPQVKAWGKACEDMQELFKKDDHVKYLVLGNYHVHE